MFFSASLWARISIIIGLRTFFIFMYFSIIFVEDVQAFYLKWKFWYFCTWLLMEIVTLVISFSKMLLKCIKICKIIYLASNDAFVLRFININCKESSLLHSLVNFCYPPPLLNLRGDVTFLPLHPPLFFSFIDVSTRTDMPLTHNDCRVASLLKTESFQS